MPYHAEWVDPEVFLVHNGVTVYHTYRDDDLDQGPRTYGFTLNPCCGEEYRCDCPAPGPCRNVFDVCELSNWIAPLHPPFLTGDQNTPENNAAWNKYREDRVEEKRIEATIREAIEKGLIVAPPEPEEGGQGVAPEPIPLQEAAGAVQARKADCLVLVAPVWFKRPDFIAWWSHPHVAKWIWADEGQDTFLVFDDDLSDDGFLPKDISQVIHAEAEKAGMKYGTIWIKSV